jgi:hypothetical protein
VTGSKQWQESGKKDTQEAINEMKVCFLLFNIVSRGFSPGILLLTLGQTGSERSEDLTTSSKRYWRTS